MLNVVEIHERLQSDQSVVVYFDRKNGNVIGYRLQDTNDHTHTTMFTNSGEVLDQFHGHARFVGENRMHRDGARYFVAYHRNRFTNKIEIRNFGRQSV